jgi:predicted SAM-dependent methyltransferase
MMQFTAYEIYLVLTKGGVLRITVPDLDLIINQYDPDHPEDTLVSVFESHQKNDKNMHNWHYNETLLK